MEWKWETTYFPCPLPLGRQNKETLYSLVKWHRTGWLLMYEYMVGGGTLTLQIGSETVLSFANSNCKKSFFPVILFIIITYLTFTWYIRKRINNLGMKCIVNVQLSITNRICVDIFDCALMFKFKLFVISIGCYSSTPLFAERDNSNKL